ncbi:MAG: proprotein convertase P-domain-containing protein [Verrucomicrobiales bacterium]|nr:proprotein convertase P-domain-containing protein [Verrucomicrobiales bacterium]MCP5560455.1 proprotein convertase P-domain-containing protein [Verrucomicrobiaceae bacterium]
MKIRSSSALLLLLFTAAAPFQVMAGTYLATWSGASYGNTAQAIARVDIDEGVLLNPGFSLAAIGSGAVVTSFDITVSGAASGNGTWSTSDFTTYILTIGDALNLAADWIGQPQPSASSVWGRSGDFSVFSVVAGVPRGTNVLELSTNSGAGDKMKLVSFAPLSFGGPGARFNVGDTVALDLSVLIESALVPNGAAGESVRLVGLPAGVVFDPATFLLSGRVLGLVGVSGVKIEVRKGSKVLRSLPYNLAVDPYPYAGGFEVLLEGPASASPNFTNTNGITINDNSDATPYPSTIDVGGIILPVTAVRVKLNGLNHSFLADLDLFLMAPGGKVCAVMSDVSGGDDAVNANLIFDDAAADSFPGTTTGSAYTTGTFKPTDVTPGGLGEIPPGTVGAVGTSLNALAAGNVNGQWKLFVKDDASGDVGSLTSWALEFDLLGPIGKIKVTLASPTTRSVNPAYSAVIERMGHPRRTARGVFTLTPGATQAVSVTVPATRTLPQAVYDLTINQATDHVTGVQNGDPTVTARGFRLIRPHRIPTGNVALNLGFYPGYSPDGVFNPGGLGYGTSTVTTAGLIPIRGLLGDAQPFTGTLCLSQTSEAVVWLTPYANKSSYVGGILTIQQGTTPIFGFLPGRNPSPPPPIGGGLQWNVRPDAKAKAYSGGCGPLALNPFVSRWSPLRTAEDLGRSLDLSFRNLMINYMVPPAASMGEVLPITGMPTQWVLRDNLSLVNVSAGTHPTTARANPKNGTFVGTIKLPAPATRTTVSGIFAQETFIFPFPGLGLFKVPVSGPGLPVGAYRTAGYFLMNQ